MRLSAASWHTCGEIPALSLYKNAPGMKKELDRP
jgi:hypothetical protein